MKVFVTAANRGKKTAKTLNSQLVFCGPERAKTHVRQSRHPKKNFWLALCARHVYLAAFGGSAVSVPSKKYLPLQHCISVTRGNFLRGQGLFLGGPALHPMVVT